VGPLLVVFMEPGLCNLPHLLDGVEHVGVEHLAAIGFVEALDERVLIRFTRLGELQSDTTALAPLREGDRVILRSWIGGGTNIARLFLARTLGILDATRPQKMSLAASAISFPLILIAYGLVLIAAVSPSSFLHRIRLKVTALSWPPRRTPCIWSARRPFT
jgi:hypothetical protein